MKKIVLIICLFSSTFLVAQNDARFREAMRYSKKNLGRNALDLIWNIKYSFDYIDVGGNSSVYSSKGLPFNSTTSLNIGLISIQKTLPFDIYLTTGVGVSKMSLRNVPRDTTHFFRTFKNINTLGVSFKLGNYKDRKNANYFVIGAEGNYTINFAQLQKDYKYFNPRIPLWLAPMFAYRANFLNGWYHLFAKKNKYRDRDIFVDNTISISGFIGYELQSGGMLLQTKLIGGAYLKNDFGDKLLNHNSESSPFRGEPVRSNFYVQVQASVSGLFQILRYNKSRSQRKYNYYK